MELEFIRDLSAKLSVDRRSELSGIAESHFDRRLSLEQMIEKIHVDNASISEEEMFYVISVLHYMASDKSLSRKPVLHCLKVEDENVYSFREMQGSQFTQWNEGSPLIVKALFENPGYESRAVEAEYAIDLIYENGRTYIEHVTGRVSMGANNQFCIATFHVPNPNPIYSEVFKAWKVRLNLREKEDEKILASKDFTEIHIKNQEKYDLFIKVRESYIFKTDAPDKRLKSMKEGSCCELGIRFKFQQQFFSGLESVLPEIEVPLYVSEENTYSFKTRKILKAKPYRENGETVYIAEDIFLSQETCRSLLKGSQSYGLFIWDKAIIEGKFIVDDEEILEEIEGEYIDGVLYHDVGKSYKSEPQQDTAKEDKKEPKEKNPYEYLKLDSLNLYRQDVLDEWTAGDNLDGQITFKEGFSGEIAIYASFNYLQGELKYADFESVEYRLYDSTGRLLRYEAGTQSSEDSGDGKKYFFSHAEFEPAEGKWEKGLYRIEASLWHEIIISIKFEVCDKDTYGMFDPEGSQPRINHGGRKIVASKEGARKELDELVGLKRIKEKVDALKEVNKFAMMRQQAGLSFKRQSLHACFVGSSGTGKTTVAGIIGQIYQEMGLLSKGHVVFEERSTLIGRYYDSELRETERALRNADGGILFIDEAYSLYVEDDPRDPGHKVIEALLTALSDESKRDWMLVLAGYPDQMEKMLNSNPGIKSRVGDMFYFDDMTQDELIEVADLYCRKNDFILSPEARRALESVIAHDYASRSKNFGNARYVNYLLEKQVVPAMATRLCSIPGEKSRKQLMTIEKEDIPAMRRSHTSKNMNRLNEMIGLESLKQNISKHLNFVRMINNRISHGLHTSMPPLHMIFTGNPGTGKSTVADFMGEIYASIGVLSHGEVIKVERRDIVGQHLGETEEKMNAILERAKGNVLFIDEAYQLWNEHSANDYGRVAVESLLGVMANDQLDMIVILAGYTKEMEKLIEMNSGLKSRFPYTFHFEDYTTDELIEIAKLTVKRERFSLSPDAEKHLAALIKREVGQKQASFGNARFVNRLISTSILPAMASRLAALEDIPDKTMLTTILKEDIPISADEASRIELGSFDETAISSALKRLDEMIGLKYVKRTIHNFVDTARYTSSERQQMFGNQVMKWNFIGNTGTGKSTIAKIMADILKAMGLIGKNEVVEIKGEEFYNVPEYRCDEILRKAMEKAKYGLLFVDSDAPVFRNAGSWALTGEQLRIKLASLTAEIGGNGAIIIAECESSRPAIGPSLAKKGVFGIDRTLIFEDYSSEELFRILEAQLKRHKAQFSDEAAAQMRAYIDALCDNRSLDMANARTMKLLSQSILQIMLLRESHEAPSGKGIITAADVDSFEWHKPYRKIGF